MVVIVLAHGFEEIEALTPADVLRRAGLRVTLCGVGGREITGSHGIKVLTDAAVEDVDPREMDALLLPGGGKGTENLEASPIVQRLIDEAAGAGKLIGAICAAPSILAHKGLLRGRRATAFPQFQKDLTEGGAALSEEFVCRDGNFITARGMGVSLSFGLKLAEALVSREKAEEIAKAVQMEGAGR